MSKFKWSTVIINIVSIFVVAGLGSLFVNLGMDWFGTLLKPMEWVPNILIPIIWTIIYITFAIMLILWQNIGFDKKLITLLIINGALNIIWCLVFFTLNSLIFGLVIIILNLIAGFYLVINMIKKSELYGNILLIYPIWLSIATTLNLAVWILN